MIITNELELVRQTASSSVTTLNESYTSLVCNGPLRTLQWFWTNRVTSSDAFLHLVTSLGALLMLNVSINFVKHGTNILAPPHKGMHNIVVFTSAFL